MYEIWADDLLIYSDISPLETVKVIEPKLTLADCAAGSLEMTLPPINVGYNVIKRMITDIIVKCEGEEIWRGRVLSDDYDFWNRRKMVVEGALAFLNDSIQPPAKYMASSTTIITFMQSLLDIHNSQVPANRQLELGMVTVHDDDAQEDEDAIYRFTNYETTLECFNEKLVDRFGGHLRVQRRKDDNNVWHLYLDYISDENIGQNNQIIRFGVNLMDFVKSFDMSELATALVPRGARLEEEEIEGLEPYLTVKSLGNKYEENPTTGDQELWHAADSLFVLNPSAVATYGQITAVVDWDNVTDPENLYTKAKKYLEDEQYEKMVLEIKAIDLHYAGVQNQRIKMLDKLRCISEPHGMDHTFPITQMEIRLDKPDDSMYTLGTEVNLTLSQSTSKVNQETIARIESLPTKHAILKAAQENAFKILMGVDGGYVRFNKYSKDPEDPHYSPDPNMWDVIYEIVISDGPTDEMSLHKWVFNEGGLGHMTRLNYETAGDPPYDDTDYPWQSVNVAMTMDGSIVADRITTGIFRSYNGTTGFSLDTSNGKVIMNYGQFGPWLINNDGRGFTNGRNAWIDPDQISCGNYGATFIGMRGSSSSQNGYLEVGVNANIDCIHVFWDSILRIDNGGTKYAVWDSGSDERLKKDIRDLTIEESKLIIDNVTPLVFKYKSDDKCNHYGFTAQRIDALCEKLGIDNPFTVDGEMKDDLKRIDYTQFITPLIKVVQHQQKEIEELKKFQNE